MAPRPGFLDRLLARRPALDKPRSDSGRFHTQGFLDEDELNNDLRGKSGLRVYNKMYRGDHDVRRNVMMVVNALVGATWSFDPFGGDEATDQDKQVADDCEWALGLGTHRSNTPLLTPWAYHLAEFLPVLIRSGFAPGEVTWTAGKRDGRDLVTPRKIGLRLPLSIWRWITDPADDALQRAGLTVAGAPGDELLALEQFRQSRGDFVLLPRQDLVYYRVGIEGDNWEGISMLRPVYKAWLIKDKLERLDAMGHEREAVGLPTVYPPTNHASLDSGILDDLEAKMAALRAGELAYLMMPGPSAETNAETGWLFKIEGLSGSDGGGKRDANTSIERWRDAISAAFIQEFMRLGQGGEGSKGALATAQVQDDPFTQALLAIAEPIVAEVLQMVVRRFVTLNHGPDVPLPTMKVSLRDEDVNAMVQAASALAGAGMLFADDQLEDFMRQRLGLPPADPAAREQRKAQEEETRQAELEGMKAGPAVGNDETKTVEKKSVKRGADGSKTESREVHKTQSKARTLDDGTAPGTKDAGKLQITTPMLGHKCEHCGKHHPADEDCDHHTLAHEPRPWEALMPLDQLRAALDTGQDVFVTDAAAALSAVALQAAQDALAGTEGPQAPNSALTDALTRALAGAEAVGRASVTAELAAQRDHGAPTSLDEDLVVALAATPGDELPKRGWLAARAIVQAITNAVFARHADGITDPVELQQAGELAGRGAAKAEAAAHVPAALNQGRDTAASDHADEIKGARYTSILDKNRCEVCAMADDGVLRALTDPVRLARRPPNARCQSTLGGRNRCRCMEFYELKDETPSSLDAGDVEVDYDDPAFTLDYDPTQPRDPDGRWTRLPHPHHLEFKAKLGGSTGAQLRADSHGRLYVTKKGGNTRHLLEEDAADSVYRAAGIPVPDSQVHATSTGPVKVARHLTGGKPLSKLNAAQRSTARKQLRQGFALDALLANWDVIGLDRDNAMLHQGTLYRIDNGGALRYRAMGKPKGTVHSYPTELWSMREQGTAGDVFGNLPWDQVMDQARGLLDKREQLLDALPGQGQRAWLKVRLNGLADIVRMHDSGLTEAQIRHQVGVGPAPKKWTGQGTGMTLLEDEWPEDCLELAFDQDDELVFTLGKAWDPDLHPRDEDGRFKVKIGGIPLGVIQDITSSRDVQKAIKYGTSTEHTMTKGGVQYPVVQHTIAAHGPGLDALESDISTALAGKAYKSAPNPSAAKQGLEKALKNVQQAKQAHQHHAGKAIGKKAHAAKPKAVTVNAAGKVTPAPAHGEPMPDHLAALKPGDVLEGTGFKVVKVNPDWSIDIETSDGKPSELKAKFVEHLVATGQLESTLKVKPPAGSNQPPAPIAGQHFTNPSGTLFKVHQLDPDGTIHFEKVGEGSGIDSGTVTAKEWNQAFTGSVWTPAEPPAQRAGDVPDLQAAADAAAAAAKPKPGKKIKGAQTTHHLSGINDYQGNPAAAKFGDLDLAAGDIVQRKKGGNKLTLIEPHPTAAGYWKVQTASGKAKYLGPSQRVAFVTKADGSEVKLKNGAAPAPAAPAAPKVTADSLKGSLIVNSSSTQFADLPKGTAFQTLDGKLAVLDPDTPAYTGYITAWTGGGSKVEVPQHVAPTKILTPKGPATAKVHLDLMQAAPAPTGAAKTAAKKQATKSKLSVADSWKGIPNGPESKTKVAGWQKGTHAKLSGEQKSALQGYTDGTYSSINGALRNEDLDVYKLKQVQQLDSVFDAIDGIPEDIITHRGTHLGALTGTVEPGKVIYDRGYMSTSPTKPWEKPVILHIRLKKGSKALWGPTTGGDVTSSEDEIILRRSTMMHVLQVEEVGGKKHIYVEAYA